MSLGALMNIATSGLQTAQEQLKVVSDNITNVSTPGYIRKVANQETRVAGGQSSGVTAGTVTIAADKYLEATQFKATSASSQADAAYGLLDQIQSQFGDLTDPNGLFNQAANTLSTVAQAAETPNSSAARREFTVDLAGFLDTGQRIAGQIQTIRAQADSQIGSDVQHANDLLASISQLNKQVSSGAATGDDTSAAQMQQATAVQSLAQLLDITTSIDNSGGMTVRTQSGTVLVSGNTNATLSYTPTANVNAATTFNSIKITGANGATRDFSDSLSSGELRGLLDVRDNSSVAINEQLNQYMSQFANQLNAVHNASSAVPAPASLTGKSLDQTIDEAVTGFTGPNGSSPTETNLVTLDPGGNITHRLTLDFDGSGNGTGTWSVDGGARTGSFGASSFISDVNSAFVSIGSSAALTFTNGQLGFASNSAEGVAIVDPPAGSTPPAATKAGGQGFSQFFGLNDLVTSSVPTSTNTGLTSTATAGFVGGSVDLTIKSAVGSKLADVKFAMPTSGTMADLVSALNDANTGIGRYGSFSLDPNGALTYQGFGNPANALSIASDTTARLSSTGVTFSQFFGLGGNSSTVAQHLVVNPTVANNANLLSLAQVNLNPAAGMAALLPSDGSGGNLLAAVANKSVTFAKTGLNGGGVSTLTNYGADLAGQIGNLSAQAKSTKEASDALLNDATSRRSASEGVNLDEELVNLTTYQQAYSAAGRLVQASSDLFSTLLSMTQS